MSPSSRKLPNAASFAIPAGNGKLHAPSAVRNVDSIIHAIRAFVPTNGKALEIASGTGEHIVRYAAEFPGVRWQPTDIALDRLESITAWTEDVKLSRG